MRLMRLLILILALIPLVWWPMAFDGGYTNKFLLLLLGAVFALTVWTINVLRQKKLEFNLRPVALGFLGLSFASWLSFIFTSYNKPEGMMLPFGPVFFTAVAIIFVFVRGILDEKDKTWARRVIYAVVCILDLIAIYQFFGRLKWLLPNFVVFSDPLWTPVGSSLGLIGINLIILPYLAHELWQAKRHGDKTTRVVVSLLVVGNILATLLTIVRLLPESGRLLITYKLGLTTWLGSWTNLKAVFLGVGGENFLPTFTHYRPEWLLATDLWNVRLETSASLFLHLVTIYGVLGLIGFLALGATLILSPATTWTRVRGILGVLCLLIIPPNVSLTILIALIIFIDQQLDKQPEKTTSLPWWGGAVIGGMMGVGLTLGMVGLGRWYWAEFLYAQSARAASNNEGTKTYNTQIEVIKWNPYPAKYHISYSQTNLALASNLMADITRGGRDAESEKKDRTLATNLLQQAIREAKLAVTLSPNNIYAWENLAAVYTALSDSAQNADSWAIAAYQKVIELDPKNPTLISDLGTVYVKHNRLDEARGQFLAALKLKPNFANALYNLAYVEEQSGNIETAIKYMEETLRLTDPASAEFKRLTNQLYVLQGKLK